ncbi:hypothetical protein WN48_05561 [Eufriesea mexicana]|uniref:Uncharacterized protein n=1 Tax=Eufriesea mexicana TaxID=516756 RepID=A0A310S9F1_9HYME|nr:hypothetical protein WN48_05561 [Eufriesea mexicana]
MSAIRRTNRRRVTQGPKRLCTNADNDTIGHAAKFPRNSTNSAIACTDAYSVLIMDGGIVIKL